MKKIICALTLFILITTLMTTAAAHDWRKVIIEHARADYSNNEALVVVKIDNNFEDIKNLKLTAMILELGIRKQVGPFKLDKGKEEIKHAVLGLEDAEPGEYVVRITVNDGNIRRVKHRFITIP